MKRFEPERIKRRRIELGISQLELARLSGLTNVALSLIENGRKKPKLESVLKISDALKTGLEYFFVSHAN